MRASKVSTAASAMPIAGWTRARCVRVPAGALPYLLRQTRTYALPPGLDKLPCTEGAPRLVIGKGKANLFLDGNPIVFTNAVQSVDGAPATGDSVIVSDWKNSAIAWGVYNSDSLFKCRVLQLDREVRAHPDLALDVPALVRYRVQAAARLRRDLGLPSAETDVYRLVNSEGDRLSGLVVDVLGQHLVVSSSALWVEKYKEVISEVLRGVTQLPHLTWRSDASMLTAERGGVRDGGAGSSQSDDGSSEQTDADDAPAEDAVQDRVVVTEAGVRYATDPLGQKTGFYADQRENRVFLRRLVQGKRVLDLCCYSGGFAINAALHGATEVLGVDSAASAIALANENAALNGVADRCKFECAKIEKFLAPYESIPGDWDVVILDPPKLAPSKKVLDRALVKYTSLNGAAMLALKPGGLLMTCSCSGAVAQGPPGTLLKAATAAARPLRRPVTVLREGGASADHVLDPHFPQGRYLKNLLLRVGEP